MVWKSWANRNKNGIWNELIAMDKLTQNWPHLIVLALAQLDFDEISVNLIILQMPILPYGMYYYYYYLIEYKLKWKNNDQKSIQWLR